MPVSRNRAKSSPSLRESMRRRFQSGGANRISNRELRRQAKIAVASGYRAYMTLLAVLAQKGGDVTVTQGTIDQVGKNYANLSYTVTPNGDIVGEFVVRLIEGKDADPSGTEAAPDVVITHPDEESHVAE